MPTVSVFIRKGDLEKWKALENKSKWLHEHLNVSDYGLEHAKELTQSLSTSTKLRQDLLNKSTLKQNPELFKKIYKLCKHGADPKLCKHAKVINGKKVCK